MHYFVECRITWRQTFNFLAICMKAQHFGQNTVLLQVIYKYNPFNIFIGQIAGCITHLISLLNLRQLQ